MKKWTYLIVVTPFSQYTYTISGKGKWSAENIIKTAVTTIDLYYIKVYSK